MGYYMRYLVQEYKDIDLEKIENALINIDRSYSLVEKDFKNEYAELMWGRELYGELEINRINSELMDEEMDELIEGVDEASGAAAAKVKQMLSETRLMIVVRVLWQGRETDDTFDKIDPLWDWLFSEYKGLLQADGEGYYDVGGQVLMVE